MGKIIKFPETKLSNKEAVKPNPENLIDEVIAHDIVDEAKAIAYNILPLLDTLLFEQSDYFSGLDCGDSNKLEGKDFEVIMNLFILMLLRYQEEEHDLHHLLDDMYGVISNYKIDYEENEGIE